MTDFMDLSGKTVLVTGASRGIGEAILRSLVAQGASVILHYNTGRDRAYAIADQVGRDVCLPVHANLAYVEDIETLWNTAVNWKGRIDTLVNNAAVRQPISLTAEPNQWDDHWITALRVNLLATAHLSRMAILHFEKAGGGNIIGISARIAVRGDRPEFFHDGASKGGMNSLLRGIARAYADRNIQTYIICAGVIATQQSDEMSSRYGIDDLLSDIPAGKLGEPEDVANVVVFCASGKAKYSSGTTIDVTGASYIH